MSFIAAAAVIGGVGSVVGGLISGSAASSAASEQANASANAQNIAQNEFNTITQQESPYMQAGYGAQSQLNYLLGIGTPGSSTGNGGGTASSSSAGGYGSLNTPFTASYMQQYSPAYQFQLKQGEQGVLNQDASSQGALSGSALKDLISYNQQSANTAYNSAFNQYQTQQNNTYSRLSGVAQLGQNAAANTGEQGTSLANSAAQSATNIGTAQAGGTVGSANAYSGALSNASSLGSLYALYGGGGSGGSGGGYVSTDTGSSVPAGTYYG